jgi:hypothetical protein
MAVIDVPAAVAAATFALLSMLAWRRAPACARVMLATATAFAIAAGRFPGRSVDQILAEPDGLAYLVAAARVAGLTALLVFAVSFLRGRFAPH